MADLEASKEGEQPPASKHDHAQNQLIEEEKQEMEDVQLILPEEERVQPGILEEVVEGLSHVGLTMRINDDAKPDYLKFVQVRSDAWPEGIKQKPALRSAVAHETLVQIICDSQFRYENIEYKVLENEDIISMRQLHEEWFPLTYPQSFYDRINKNNVIAIGCFYKVQVNGDDELILIGCIISRIQKETEKNESVLKAIDGQRWDRQSWYERVKETFSCGTMFQSQRKACYIMTIGVLDECRKLGLGTQMLDYTIDLIEQTFEQCIAIYLHVVDYNESAIKFYLKNNFIQQEKLVDHYLIHKKNYDAIVLYRPIGNGVNLMKMTPEEMNYLKPQITTIFKGRDDKTLQIDNELNV